MGDPKDPATELGPLASEEHWKKVTGYLDDIAAGTGRMLTGGPADGWFVRPTVVVDAPLDSRRRLRGGVRPAGHRSTPSTPRTRRSGSANDSPYGLNAMVFTENLSRAHRVSAALTAGTVWVNCFFIRDLRAPFGGVGDSGVGREGGTFSREFFTEPKAVVMQL